MTLPVALDTNLLVRLLTGDEPEQARPVHLLHSERCARFATLDPALAKAASALDRRPAVQSL
jgi:hypothetical protein